MRHFLASFLLFDFRKNWRRLNCAHDHVFSLKKKTNIITKEILLVEIMTNKDNSTNIELLWYSNMVDISLSRSSF